MLSFEIARRKARRRSVSVSLLWCSGRITQIQVCGILFGIMRTGIFLSSIYYTYGRSWRPELLKNVKCISLQIKMMKMMTIVIMMIIVPSTSYLA